MNNKDTKTIHTLDIEELNQAIINTKKTLLDYRFKQATKQSVKSHIIKQCKKKLARMMTIEHKKIMDRNR